MIIYICDECATQPEYKKFLKLVEKFKIQGRVIFFQDGDCTPIKDLCSKHIEQKRNAVKWE